MKIYSPLPRKRGRIEIIPLIDIMFFLLASFMMVSLTMQHLMAMRVSLPTATQAKSLAKTDMITVTVDRYGQTWINGKQTAFAELFKLVKRRVESNPNFPVYIQGQKETTHAAMIYVLDLVRRAGVQKVAFSVKIAETTR
jgi:biopolymer transport protein ExbD